MEEAISIDDIQKIAASIRDIDPSWVASLVSAISENEEWKKKKRRKATEFIVRNVVYGRVESQWMRRIFIECAVPLIEQGKKKTALLKKQAMQYASEA